jgi:hypothetical protein
MSYTNLNWIASKFMIFSGNGQSATGNSSWPHLYFCHNFTRAFRWSLAFSFVVWVKLIGRRVICRTYLCKKPWRIEAKRRLPMLEANRPNWELERKANKSYQFSNARALQMPYVFYRNPICFQFFKFNWGNLHTFLHRNPLQLTQFQFPLWLLLKMKLQIWDAWWIYCWLESRVSWWDYD